MKTTIKKTIIVFAVMLVLTLCLGCSDDNNDDGADGDAEEAEHSVKPVQHGRSTLQEKTKEYLDSECLILPEGTEEYDCRAASQYDECSFHSDCPERENGFCRSVGSNICRCYYHECLEDTDCAANEACVCYAWHEHSICAKSCRSSDECGEGHKCVIAGQTGGCISPSEEEILGSQGFRCTSDADECTSDNNCPKYDRCVYTEEKGHFSCEYDKWLENCEGIES